MKQIELDLEAAARDRALDLLEEHRAPMIEMAKMIAEWIAKKKGRVTSTDVICELRARGYGELLDSVDKRFLGAVFRAGKGWKRIGFESTGSHRRPVSIWRLG